MKFLLALLLLLAPAAHASVGMFSLPSAQVASAEIVSYTANGVNFNNSPFLVRGAGLTSATDSKVGTFSAWVWMKGNNNTINSLLQINNSGISKFSITRSAANTFAVFGRRAADTTTVLNYGTTTTYNSGMTGYVHVLASWDLAAGYARIYVDDVNRTSTPTIVDNAIDLTGSDWQVGRGPVAGGQLLNGWVADMYFAQEFLDIDVEANRRKFISSSGDPVDLGASGQLPTGNQPIVFLKGDASIFANNVGYGGAFTVSGTLNNAGSNPP